MREAENMKKDFWVVFPLKVKYLKLIKCQKKPIEKTRLKK